MAYKLTISEIHPEQNNERTELVIRFYSSGDAWRTARALTDCDDYARGQIDTMADHGLTGTVHLDPLCRVAATVTSALTSCPRCGNSGNTPDFLTAHTCAN